MQLTPDQINEFVAKAVLDSQLGDAVKASVQRVMADLQKSYNNPFDEVIKRHVIQLIDAEVMKTYAPLLEAGIKQALQDKMTNDFINSVIDAGFERLRRNY